MTVLIPVRNGAATIAVAIADLLAGMGPDDEMLIIDDGSKDQTPVILDSLVRQDSRMRLISTRGVGLVEALNLGVTEATHQWIVRADADDRYPLGRLGLQRTELRPDVALVTGDYSIMVNGKPVGLIPTALGDPAVKLSLINPQRIPHPGVVLSKVAVQEAGGYRQEDFPAEDLGLWVRLREQGLFLGVPGPVVAWRMNPQSVTHTRQTEQRKATRRLVAGIRATTALMPEEEIRAELARYRQSPLGSARALLLARDLMSAGQLGLLRPGTRGLLTWMAARPLQVASAASRLVREQRVRSAFRNDHLAAGPGQADDSRDDG